MSDQQVAGVPFTSGRVWWVAPGDSYLWRGQTYPASDNNDGLSPSRALRLVNRAWALAGVGDVIVLLPGTHTVTTSIAANVATVTMMGIASGPQNQVRQRTVIAGPTADEIMNITAAEVKVANITFQPTTASTAVDLTSGAPRCQFSFCSFDTSVQTASTSTKGIVTLSGATYLAIENCAFQNLGAQGPAIDLTATARAVVRDCTFTHASGTWAVALQFGASSSIDLVQRCSFLDYAGTITVGIDGTGVTATNGVTVADCRFGVGVTVPIDNFDANECLIVENYKGGVGATDGGSLITVIT